MAYNVQQLVAGKWSYVDDHKALVPVRRVWNDKAEAEAFVERIAEHKRPARVVEAAHH